MTLGESGSRLDDRSTDGQTGKHATKIRIESE